MFVAERGFGKWEEVQLVGNAAADVGAENGKRGCQYQSGLFQLSKSSLHLGVDVPHEEKIYSLPRLLPIPPLLRVA